MSKVSPEKNKTKQNQVQKKLTSITTSITLRNSIYWLLMYIYVSCAITALIS